MRKITHKPSDFATTYPWSSVAQKSETESIAVNIMKILKRTGDEWRELTWEEYKEIRLADEAAALAKDPKYRINFAEYLEKPAFEQALPYTTSAAKACEFSRCWKEIVHSISIKITMWGADYTWKGFLHTTNTAPMGIAVRGKGRNIIVGARGSVLEGITLILPYVRFSHSPNDDNDWKPGGTTWQRVTEREPATKVE
jgi:hypothetical protein